VFYPDAVDFTEFDRLVEPLRARSAAMKPAHGFGFIDGRTVSAQELLDAEQLLGVKLPSRYKTFMMRYGGGQFGSVDLLPVTPIPGGEDVVSVSQREDRAGSFVVVAPVGTGDYLGFPVIDGGAVTRCGSDFTMVATASWPPTTSSPSWPTKPDVTAAHPLIPITRTNG